MELSQFGARLQRSERKLCWACGFGRDNTCKDMRGAREQRLCSGTGVRARRLRGVPLRSLSYTMLAQRRTRFERRFSALFVHVALSLIWSMLSLSRLKKQVKPGRAGMCE